jgi:lipopolysaccharide/colanic/teichoic acid biosynthesis glycosyltransferase
MRAVIFSSGEWPGIAPLNERCPAPLLPLVDRPFLQHVVEYLASQGVRQFDFVLCHLPEKIEQFLGDGRRWGCSFAYHLVRDPERPYGRLRTLNWGTNDCEPILLGHAEQLPQLHLPDVGAEGACGATAFMYRPFAADRPQAALEWTGWAILPASKMAHIPLHTDPAGFHDWVLNQALEQVELPQLLSAASFRDLLTAHTVVLGKEFSGLLWSGRHADPGVWLSRNVVLHPTAQLVPPVYIGADTQVGAGVRLGPDVAIGNGCVLDSRAALANAVVFPGSYVGEGLVLTDAVVDKNQLIHPRRGTVVAVTDNFILGNMAEEHIRRWLVRRLWRLTGLLLLILSLPLLVVTAVLLKLFREGPVVYRKKAVRLPATPQNLEQRIFRFYSFVPFDGLDGQPLEPRLASLHGILLRFLPALMNVVRGELNFVGVPPRAPAEIRALPRDWQTIYLAGKPGIVTEAAVVCGHDPSEDEVFATETVYVASAGGRYDLKLLARYLYRACFGFSVRRSAANRA